MMPTKEECLAALDKLENDLKNSFDEMSGNPSKLGHDREVEFAIIKLEESIMWMRRAIERKFA